MTFYRRLLKIVQIFVILVVLPRVASFLALLGGQPGQLDAHDIIRWAFALALGSGVVATSYFSEELQVPEYDDEPQPSNRREIKRREREAAYFAAMNNIVPKARRALWVFAFLDGSFNLGDAVYSANQNGLFDPARNGYWVILYGIVTITFGISPTLLSAVLSRVISATDRVPTLEDLGKPRTSEPVFAAAREPNRIETTERPLLEVRRTPNSERTANLERRPSNGNGQPGEQSSRIIHYLDMVYEQTGTLPSYSQIQAALGDPIPSKSTLSATVNRWKEERAMQGSVTGDNGRGSEVSAISEA